MCYKMGKTESITVQTNMFIHQTLGYSMSWEVWFVYFGVFAPTDILLEQCYTNG